MTLAQNQNINTKIIPALNQTTSPEVNNSFTSNYNNTNRTQRSYNRYNQSPKDSSSPLKFKLERYLGTLHENSKNHWSREINIVSWNDAPPKYDIRDWDPLHQKMSKGIALTLEELYLLYDFIGVELDRVERLADTYHISLDEAVSFKEADISDTTVPPITNALSYTTANSTSSSNSINTNPLTQFSSISQANTEPKSSALEQNAQLAPVTINSYLQQNTSCQQELAHQDITHPDLNNQSTALQHVQNLNSPNIANITKTNLNNSCENLTEVVTSESAFKSSPIKEDSRLNPQEIAVINLNDKS